MTSLTNPGNTSKNLYSFESGYVVPKDFSGICEIKNSICYYKDGPAVENADGSKEWYINNILYGENNDFNNNSWIHFQKTLIF